MTVKVDASRAIQERVRAARGRVSFEAIALRAAVAAVVIFLAAPIVALILISFTAGEYITFPPVGFSTKWYGKVLGMPGFVDSLLLSVRLAAMATALSIVLGVAAALGISRSTFRGRQALLTGMMSPLMVPMIVTGLALLQFFHAQNMRAASWNLVVGHVIITLPYVVRTVTASLEVFDWSLIDTARVLGAGPVGAVWRVLLPIIRPGILAGGIFAFLTSFDNYTISMFLADADLVPLPVQVLYYIQAILDPTIAALSSALIFGSAIILIISDRLVGASQLKTF